MVIVFTWEDVLADVPLGFIIGPLCIFIFSSDLPDGLHINFCLFPDDTSLFSVMIDSLRSSNLLYIRPWLIRGLGFSVENIYMTE